MLDKEYKVIKFSNLIESESIIENSFSDYELYQILEQNGYKTTEKNLQNLKEGLIKKMYGIAHGKSNYAKLLDKLFLGDYTKFKEKAEHEGIELYNKETVTNKIKDERDGTFEIGSFSFSNIFKYPVATNWWDGYNMDCSINIYLNIKNHKPAIMVNNRIIQPEQLTKYTLLNLCQKEISIYKNYHNIMENILKFFNRPLDKYDQAEVSETYNNPIKQAPNGFSILSTDSYGFISDLESNILSALKEGITNGAVEITKVTANDLEHVIASNYAWIPSKVETVSFKELLPSVTIKYKKNLMTLGCRNNVLHYNGKYIYLFH